jgi:hypothetical protein
VFKRESQELCSLWESQFIISEITKRKWDRLLLPGWMLAAGCWLAGSAQPTVIHYIVCRPTALVYNVRNVYFLLFLFIFGVFF